MKKIKIQMTSHNVALCYRYSIVGYISIYSYKDFPSLKNDEFDFQLAFLSNELDFFLCGLWQNDLLWQLYQHIKITLE